MRSAVFASALLLLACDPPKADPAPAPAPAKRPDPFVDDPAVQVDLCRVLGSEVDKVNLWERPTPKDAVGVVDRGAVVGHALASQKVSVSFETSTSYYVDMGKKYSGWVSKSLAPFACAPPVE